MYERGFGVPSGFGDHQSQMMGLVISRIARSECHGERKSSGVSPVPGNGDRAAVGPWVGGRTLPLDRRGYLGGIEISGAGGMQLLIAQRWGEG